MLIKPAPSVTPICPFFYECGGCDSQDISYADQLAAKEAWVTELFAELNPATSKPILGNSSEYPTFYRNKIRFSFVEKNGAVLPARHGKGEKSADVAVDECYLQSEISNQAVRITAEVATKYNWKPYNPSTEHGWLKHLLIREGKQTGELMLALVTDDVPIPGLDDWIARLRNELPLTSLYQNIAYGKGLEEIHDQLLWGAPYITEKIGEYAYQISPQAFFQTNSSSLETLYNEIRSTAGNGSLLWDLYAGSASIGIYLSKQFDAVVSIESNPANCADAQENLTRNAVQNVQIVQGKVEDILTSAYLSSHPVADSIIVDPPRAGLHPRFLTLLSGLPTRQIIYVSCNPITAVRDAKLLCQAGYHIDSLQPIDMFPHTWHCELILRLTR